MGYAGFACDRETCEEFGVDYRHFASYKDVIDNTHDYLTKLSYKS